MPPVPPSSAPSSAFLDAFRIAAGATGVLPFDAFMRLALYHPLTGYYRRDRPRVGRERGTDFFTATSSGPVFGELVCAAATALLGGKNAAATHTFVEIGAEPGRGILENMPHPFAAIRTIGIGDEIKLDGRCVVFSNELFDAQPCRRFVFSKDHWSELGVALHGTTLAETFLPAPPPPLPPQLPPLASEGYHLDLPIDSVALAEQIAAQPWRGLFIACDYGKSWRELTEATPAGTARAYHRHTQSNDLLARPGEQDLTCHICWDWLIDALALHHFAAPPPVLESQEAFFVHHAADAIAAIAATEATRLSQRKLALMQLLHPAHLGQKFQVLHAART